MYCGIDVGIKKCVAAVITDKVLWIGNYDELEFEDLKAVGVDAPLSFPISGSYRECERRLIEMGIRLFPPKASFFKKVSLKGIEIARKLTSKGFRVFEVYPYATRVILDIAPKVKKRKRSETEKIRKELERFVEIPKSFQKMNHDELDAVISALTVKLFFEGKGTEISGKDGSIIIPNKK
ncbi:MAG: DUF429 domain-containing protein [Archaeoglobales archaeon]|nr:DUF429 domain-containing protein [Archaeoglobales archaeon]